MHPLGERGEVVEGEVLGLAAVDAAESVAGVDPVPLAGRDGVAADLPGRLEVALSFAVAATAGLGDGGSALAEIEDGHGLLFGGSG